MMTGMRSGKAETHRAKASSARQCQFSSVGSDSRACSSCRYTRHMRSNTHHLDPCLCSWQLIELHPPMDGSPPHIAYFARK